LLPCRGNLRRYNILRSNILFDAVFGPFPACPARPMLSGLQSSRPATCSSLLIRVLAHWSKLSPLSHISLPKSLPSIGWGSAYPRGSGCLTHPPRADSLTFKNRSESWRVALGQEHSRREDVAIGRFYQLLEAQVQLTLQCGPLRCVSEC